MGRAANHEADCTAEHPGEGCPQQSGVGVLRTSRSGKVGLGGLRPAPLGFRQRSPPSSWRRPQTSRRSEPEFARTAAYSRVMTTNFTVSLSFSGGSCKWLGSLENTSRHK